MKHTMRLLAGQMRPCRRIPEAEAWEASFEAVQFRYNFLVLDGPSMMDNTPFCRSRSLGMPGALLEIDCAGVDTPDLTSNEFGRHTVVLCDEGSADMVLRYKKLVQASAAPHTPCVEPDELPRVRRVGAWGQHRGHQQPVVARVDAHAGRGRRMAVAEFSVCVRGCASVVARCIGLAPGAHHTPRNSRAFGGGLPGDEQ